jgi:hypothetical protein
MLPSGRGSRRLVAQDKLKLNDGCCLSANLAEADATFIGDAVGDGENSEFAVRLPLYT